MTESIIVFDVATLVGLGMVALAVQGAGGRIAKACARSEHRLDNAEPAQQPEDGGGE
jgi:hypothetical protein